MIRKHQEIKATKAGATAKAANNNTRTTKIHRKCLLHKHLPCCGNRQFVDERVICSECAPAGFALDKLSESAQQQVLQEALYA